MDAARKRVLTGDVSGDVLEGDGVLDGQLVALALHAALVDQDTRVGREAGEGQHDVLVQQADLLHGALLLRKMKRVQFHILIGIRDNFKLKFNFTHLQFGDGLLLDAEDDDVVAAHAHGGRALLDGLLRVFNLEI